jgi:hypothetical protein
VNEKFGDFELSWSSVLITLFPSSATGSYTVGQDNAAIVGFHHSITYGAYHSQLSQSLPCIVNYGTRPSVNHLMYFMLPKSVAVLLKINFQAIYAVWGFFYSYYWYCLSYWKQIGFLHWKWTVVFVAVLSVTVINEHGDLTVHGICKKLQWLKHIHISRSKTKIKMCPAIKII